MARVIRGRPVAGRLVFVASLLWFAALGLAPQGCDGDPAAEPAADPRAGPDTGTPPADIAALPDTTPPPADAAPEIPPEDPCLTLPFDGIVPVDLWGPDTQVNAAAAYDGAGIWVAYNRRDADGGNGLDVFATRIGCDGAVLVEPFLVNEAVAFNETDPSVAVSGDTVMFAWQSDSGATPINLSVWYRSYFTDGSPRMEADRILDFDPADATAGPRAWMPALAGTELGFTLATAAAPDGFGGFQVWLQDLDRDGDAPGAGLYVLPDVDHSQVWPALGLGSEGGLFIAWQRESVDGPTAVQYVTRTPDGVSPPMIRSDGTTAPSVALDATEDLTWIAMGYAPGAEHNVALFAADSIEAGAELHVLDNDGEIDHTPIVVSGPEANAVAWFRSLGGMKNDVLVRAFQGDAGTPKWIGAERTLNPVPAGPYAPSIVALPGGFFVVWSDGDAPDFRAKGRFVTLDEAQQ